MTLDEPPALPGLPLRVQLVLRRLDTEAGVRLLGWIIAALVGLALVVLVGRGGSTPADPRLVTSLAAIPGVAVPGRAG